MRTSHLIGLLIASTAVLFGAVTPAYAVPVRSLGGVVSNTGYYRLSAQSDGKGNFTPGSAVTVDSYLFQCRTAGSQACSTQHNSDAVLVSKWQDNLTVPNLNDTTKQVTHTFNTLPYGTCGRIQYDQGIVGVSGAIGGWVYDFGRDCPSASPTPSPTTCQAQQPVNTQFRLSGNGPWYSGNEVSNQNLRAGQRLDVNCFAKNGTALLEGGVITVQTPSGQNYRAANAAELRNFAANEVGRYTFTCSSTTINNCTDTDSLTVNVTGSAAPTPQPSPRPTPSPSVRPTPSPSPTTHSSSCLDLDVIDGQNARVPAKVKFRASGSDNLGQIQGYRFYFGDGNRTESSSNEVTHEYTSSGSFTARVEVKDSRGNYVTGNNCDTNVIVRKAEIESHKFGCADVFISADNNAKAPSLVKFTVTGFDNKGGVQGYKLDFGNGVVKEGQGSTFEQRYAQAGTYPVKAYIKNSQGEWVGGADSCQRSIVIASSQPLTRQPSTGTPTFLPLLGAGSGILGAVIEVARRRRFGQPGG